MLPSLVRRLAPTIRCAAESGSSTFKAKRTWPPDFDKLSPRHQFQLEKRYRRRAQLKWARPGWTKATKLVQWGTIAFVIVYAAFFLNWGTADLTLFHRLRAWYTGVQKDIWTRDPTETTPGPRPGSRSDET